MKDHDFVAIADKSAASLEYFDPSIYDYFGKDLHTCITAAQLQ